MESYAIPLIDNDRVALVGKFPITERDWDHLMTVLEAMKPGLVATRLAPVSVTEEATP